MSLVFAGLAPHPPLLLESIGKESFHQLTQTKQALERLEEELYLAHPQVVYIISPHEGLYENAFVVNVHEQFTASFEEFGDVVTTQTWKGPGDLGARIAHAGNIHDIPVRLVSEEKLRYGASIPLMQLTSHIKDIRIVPIGYSAMSPKDHLDFGEMLKEIILESEKRIAIIASGDLSRALTKKSPAGYHPEGKLFDEQIQELLHTRNTLGISQMDPSLVESAHQCAYRSILILLGILKDHNYRFENYSYEHPFGVGYLVGNFHI